MRAVAAERSGGIKEARAELASRLKARRPEIELALMTRVYAIANPNDLDPVYADGLKAAVSAAVDYSFGFIEFGERRSPPPPFALLAQARMASRLGVSLDTVLRRYVAGHSLLVDFAVEEAERANLLDNAALKYLLRGQTSVFDRLLEAVSSEYVREADARLSSVEQSRAERIERLIAGELLDTSDLSYEFEGQHHLGLIAKGAGASETIRKLASLLDRRLLSVCSEEDVVWAWLGGQRPFERERLWPFVAANCTAGLVLSCGEPSEGMAGWRLTHRQARAALPIALRSRESFVRYSEVALLAAVRKDDLLATSLRRLYLEPLEAERHGGKAARQTLRAYFAAGCNVSSAAVALGVNRNTVSSRLRAMEQAIGCALAFCRPEIDVALRLAELDEADVRVVDTAL